MPRRPSTYADNPAIRLETSDLIETRFAGGLADTLHSSNTSLHLDSGDPDFRVVNGRICLYHGNEKISEIVNITDVYMDDRLFQPQGHIILSSAMKKTYKAFTKALDQKLLRLTGKYACANRYIRSGMDNTDFKSLPAVEADFLYPYYYRTSSQIKGVVDYSQVIPHTNSEHQRQVTIVNVDDHSNLSGAVADRTVIYLGGNHKDQDSAIPSKMLGSSEEPRDQSTKHVLYRRNHKTYAPAVNENDEAIIAAPFPNTWSYLTYGVNVGLAKMRNGHFLYWSANDCPEPGQQISQLPLRCIPKRQFPIPEEFRTWPTHEDDKDPRLEDIFEGAWIMRGERLIQKQDDVDYPTGIVERLRVGFFRRENKTLCPNMLRIQAGIKKALGSFERYGGSMFGFDERPGGIIECTIEKLAKHLRLYVDVLLSFITQFLSSFKYFQGTVSFLICERPEGRLKITGPVPVGPWMDGGLMDTGAGLLYAVGPKKYYTVETIDDVSWLSEFTGCGSLEGRELKLGRWLNFSVHL